MILLNSEKQCIYMYKGRRAAEEEEEGGPWSTTQPIYIYTLYENKRGR
jgi:hypothetical protein